MLPSVGDQEQEPQMKWMLHYGQPGERRLAAQMGLPVVAGQHPQGVMFHYSRGNVESNAAQPRDNAHEGRKPQKPHLAADMMTAESQDLRKPSEKVTRRHEFGLQRL